MFTKNDLKFTYNYINFYTKTGKYMYDQDYMYVHLKHTTGMPNLQKVRKVCTNCTKSTPRTQP